MEKTSCKGASKMVKKIIGWNFVEMITRQFPNLTIVLKKAGLDESDLKISFNRQWVKENDTDSIAPGNKEITSIAKHLEKCQSSECLNAMKIRGEIGVNMLGHLIGALCPGLTILNPNALSEIILSEKTAGKSVFNRMLLVFELFTGENKILWVWPK